MGISMGNGSSPMTAPGYGAVGGSNSSLTIVLRKGLVNRLFAENLAAVFNRKRRVVSSWDNGQENGMTTTSYIDCEYDLLKRTRARLTTPSRVYDGRPSLTRAIIDQLHEKQLDADAYGSLLFEALFPTTGALYQGYRECLVTARASSTGVRLRLRLAPDLPQEIAGLEWSNIVDTDDHVPLALSPEMAFFIYFHGESGPLIRDRPRMLVAIAAPLDASRRDLAEIDRDSAERSLEGTLEPLAQKGHLNYDLFEGPVTAEGLRQQLDSGRFHLLHLVAHGGSPFHEGSVLALQQENGLARFLDANEVSNIFLGTALRLVTLVACDGGKPSGRNPFGELAGSLVQRGIPAVVAMRRKISFEAAERFSQSFYDELFPNGQVDVAINQARRDLSLAPTRIPEWNTPVLFMRIPDGRIWQEPEIRRSPTSWLLASLAVILVIGLIFFQSRSLTGTSSSSSPGHPSTLSETTVPSSDTLQKIEDAGRYFMAGGEENLKKSLGLYVEVIHELPSVYFESHANGQETLARAREAHSKKYYDDAAYLYWSFFERLKSDYPTE